jgi:AbiTii
MSLLDEIQADATGADVPVEVLLRKVLILATRLEHEPMKGWVHHELDGYPDDADLPPYRTDYPTQLKGNFMNVAWQAQGVAVPLTALPEGLQDLDQRMSFREGVGRIRELAEMATDGVLRFSAPAGMNAYVRLYERVQCTALWSEMSVLALTNIMDQVRNRVLAFALEIEQANPRAGDKPPDGAGPAVPLDTVSNIYNTTIYGGVNAVATGSGSASQVASATITAGDVPALLAYLRTLGVGADDVAELEDALATDAEDGDREGFGPQVTAWLGRASMKVATGTMKLAGSAGAELLALAVAKHLGII